MDPDDRSFGAISTPSAVPMHGDDAWDDSAILKAFDEALKKHRTAKAQGKSKGVSPEAQAIRDVMAARRHPHAEAQSEGDDMAEADNMFRQLLARGKGNTAEDVPREEGVPGPWTAVSPKKAPAHHPPHMPGHPAFVAAPDGTVYPKGQAYWSGQGGQGMPMPSRMFQEAPGAGPRHHAPPPGPWGRPFNTRSWPMPPPPPSHAPPPMPAGPYEQHRAAAQAMGGVSDDGLADLLMAWYYSGYYTGKYQAQQEFAEQQRRQEQWYPGWPRPH